jgi:hypothetical protein
LNRFKLFLNITVLPVKKVRRIERIGPADGGQALFNPLPIPFQFLTLTGQSVLYFDSAFRFFIKPELLDRLPFTPAFAQPRDRSDPRGLPQHRHSRLPPRVTVARSYVPHSQALRAVHTAVRCVCLPPFHSFLPSRMEQGMRSRRASAAPVRRSHHQPPLRHTGTHCPLLGLRTSGFAAFQCPARPNARPMRIPSPP